MVWARSDPCAWSALQPATSLMGLECSKVLKILEQNRNIDYPELEGTHRSPARGSAQDSPENHPNKMLKPALQNGFAGTFRFSPQPQSLSFYTSI